MKLTNPAGRPSVLQEKVEIELRRKGDLTFGDMQTLLRKNHNMKVEYSTLKMLAKRMVDAGLLIKTTEQRIAIWRLASMDESQ